MSDTARKESAGEDRLARLLAMFAEAKILSATERNCLPQQNLQQIQDKLYTAVRAVFLGRRPIEFRWNRAR